MPEGLMDPAAEVAGTTVFEAPPERGGSLPDWFQELRQQGWKEFSKLPAPSKNDESWRFSDLKRIPNLEDGFRPAPTLSDAEKAQILQRSPAAEEASVRIVFANGELLAAEILDEAFSEDSGVICSPLEQALNDHGELVKNHFAKRPAVLGSQRFAALGLANAGAGVFVFVPQGAEVSGLVQVFHWVTGDRASIFPSVTVHAEAGARISIIEHFNALGESPVFVCASTSLEAEDGASLRHAIAQDLSRSSKVVQINHAIAGKNSELKTLALHAGGDWIRQETEGLVEGAGANCNLLGVNLLFDDQFVDHRTLQRHISPDAYSDLLYKNALFDHSRSVFAGLIVVDEGAHRTDAFQTCRNLLLSDDAEANSMPGLEINADQVKCSHGATSGQIDTDQIFYLLSRGIRESDANRLVIQGFAQDVIGRLGDPALEQLLCRLLDRELERTARKGRIATPKTNHE